MKGCAFPALGSSRFCHMVVRSIAESNCMPGGKFDKRAQMSLLRDRKNNLIATYGKQHAKTVERIPHHLLNELDYIAILYDTPVETEEQKRVIQNRVSRMMKEHGGDASIMQLLVKVLGAHLG